MRAWASRGALALDTLCWRHLELCRDKLAAAGAPDPLRVLGEAIESAVEPDDGDRSELHRLVARDLAALRTTCDLFTEARVQAAMREALDLLRAEHRLGHAGP